MTRTDFNHLLSDLKELTPRQIRQLREKLDQELAESKKPPIRVAVSESKRAKPAEPKKRLTEAEFQQHLLDIGLVTSLPDPSRDIADDDPEDQPVTIKGEPLSETILRDRR